MGAQTSTWRERLSSMLHADWSELTSVNWTSGIFLLPRHSPKRIKEHCVPPFSFNVSTNFIRESVKYDHTLIWLNNNKLKNSYKCIIIQVFSSTVGGQNLWELGSPSLHAILDRQDRGIYQGSTWKQKECTDWSQGQPKWVSLHAAIPAWPSSDRISG